MKEGLTEIVAILDKSGSMETLTHDTIGGYNAFIKEQKEIPGEAVLSTILFSTGPEVVLHNRVNISKVKPITEKEYKAGGGTALLDAMGRAINHIGMVLDHTPEEERPSKVIFFIITDGEENSSEEYSYQKIKEMVELQRNTYSWEFLFMGANIDAFSAAESMGIRQDRAFNYSADCIVDVQAAASIAVGNFRRHGNVDKGQNFRKKIK
jgi:uncharacterized protein YegL